jgi:hypothetical protein
VPVAGDEQEHGELAAESDHPALHDVAAAVEYPLRKIVHEPGSVVADRGDHK